MFFRISILVMFFISSNLLADFSEDSLDWAADGTCNINSCTGKITKFVLLTELLLVIEGDMTLLNCDLDGDQYIVLESTHAQFDEIYALLLSSHMANKDVKLRVYSNGLDCRIWYVTSENS